MNLKEHLSVSSKKMIDEIVLTVENDNKLLEKLFKIAYLEDLKESWRAVWAISHIAKKHPKLIMPYSKEIIEKLPEFKNERHIGSFIHTLIIVNPDIEETGLLFDICMEQLKKDKISNYVKHYSLLMLEKICIKEPDLFPELILFLEEIENTIASEHIIHNIRKLYTKHRKTHLSQGG
jgi:hypothetical protein